jgi:hypothetical protein
MVFDRIEDDLAEEDLAHAAGEIADAAQLCGGDLRKAACSTLNSVMLYKLSASVSVASVETQKSAMTALKEVLARSTVSTDRSQMCDVTELMF